MSFFEEKVLEIRALYANLYEWHQRNGLSTIDKIRKSSEQRERSEDCIVAYQKAIDMTNPREATLDQMILVANNVRYGPLEWNYKQKVGGHTLGELANKIISIHDNIEKHVDIDNAIYYGFECNIHTDDQYFERANEIYKDVIHDNSMNIGGRVAVVDTNWEYNKIHEKRGEVFFRKPNALKFTVVSEEDNLFELAVSGKLIIESIIIG